MIDKNALHDELTEAFIGYQQRLDCPMPEPGESPEMIRLKYRTDPVFASRVRCLVAGVMVIVDKHES